MPAVREGPLHNIGKDSLRVFPNHRDSWLPTEQRHRKNLSLTYAVRTDQQNNFASEAGPRTGANHQWLRHCPAASIREIVAGHLGIRQILVIRESRGQGEAERVVAPGIQPLVDYQPLEFGCLSENLIQCAFAVSREPVNAEIADRIAN